MTAALFAQATEVSEGLPWFAYLFWMLVLVSIGYWIYRAYTHTSRTDRGRSNSPSPDAPNSPTGGRLRPPPARAEPPPRRPSTATPDASAFGAGPPDGETYPAVAPEGGTDQAGATGRAPAPTGGRSGLFAPAPAPTTRPSDQPRPTVAKLLQGITMPADLAPIVLAESTASADLGLQVAFATSGVDAAEVGRSLGDELERLGFVLDSVSDATVEADRDDGRLLVSLITDPGERRREGKKIYPSLPPNSIVVEFESI